MSLANEASLLLIPSGYKSGKVYSVFPTDGDGDFTFSRGSDGTRKGAGGLIETMSSNIPRLNYSNGDCPSLLLEPQRTNLLTYSEYLTQWTKANLSITSNQLTSPDGNQTASKVLENAVYNYHFAYNGVISVSSYTDYTYSIFVKKLGRQYVGIQTLYNTVKGAIALFDLDNGSVAYTFELGGHSVNNASIENYANDWYKISATFKVNDSTAVFGLVTADELWSYGTAYNNAYLGDITKGVYAFGGQVEQGSYSTSYIKTTGSTVTRQKDVCINGGDADLFNISEGTFFVNVTPYIYPSANTYISLNDGGSSDRFVFIFQSYGTAVRLFGVSSGVNFLSNYQNITFNQKNKIAITFKQNEFKIYVNGLLKYTDTGGNVPIGLNQLDFTEHNGNRNFQGKVHDTRVYDRVLTQSEAIELTTL